MQRLRIIYSYMLKFMGDEEESPLNIKVTNAINKSFSMSLMLKIFLGDEKSCPYWSR